MKTVDAIAYYKGRYGLITNAQGKRALAEELGLTLRRIHQFGETIPELIACKLQVLTNGALTAGLSTTVARRSRRRAVPKRSGVKQKGGGKAGVKKTARSK